MIMARRLLPETCENVYDLGKEAARRRRVDGMAKLLRFYPELQRHYRAASFLLPVGSIFVLALVVLLMVLFKRCPQMVAAIVASILGVIIIVATLISLDHNPVYT